MSGAPGLPDGCHLKKCTCAAINNNKKINDNDYVCNHVYIDGSAQIVDDCEVMTWAIAVFRVDGFMNHDLTK